MNRTRRAVGLLVLSALVGWAWPAPAVLAQSPSIVVEGQLSNATAEGAGVSDVTVVFHRESAVAHDDLETTTDDQGRFRFDGITFDPGTGYGVMVTYQGALYGVDLDLSGGSPPPVSLTVYDAVDSDDALTVSLASVLFVGTGRPTQTVSVLEIVQLVNRTDGTYVPGPDPDALLHFSLPPEARGVRVETVLPGDEVVQDAEGFTLETSVPPGEHEVLFAYDVPYTGDTFFFAKAFRYGAEHLRVLTPGELVTMSGPQMSGPDTVIIGERQYQLLEANDLPRGGSISLRLSGLPQTGLADKMGGRFEGLRFEYVGPAGLGVLMVTLIANALWRRSGERTNGATGAARLDSAQGQGQGHSVRLMIAELDESLAAGALAEDEHRRRRALLVDMLASLQDTEPATAV